MNIQNDQTMSSQELTNALQQPFPVEDIEWKIQSSGVKNGKVWALALPYVKADAIKARLDTIVGPENWKDERFEPGAAGGIQCGLSLRLNGEWITKWDGAENTNIEAIKGGMSDALKRAARMWGIGRYLVRVGIQWAKIIENGDGAYRGYIKKDNKSFSWDPPGLPMFCFPNRDGRHESGSSQGNVSRNGGQPENEEETKLLGMIKETRGLKYNGNGAYAHFTKEFYDCQHDPDRLSLLSETVSRFLDQHAA